MDGTSTLGGAAASRDGTAPANDGPTRDRDRFNQALWIALGAPETAPPATSPGDGGGEARSSLGDGTADYLKTVESRSSAPERGGSDAPHAAPRGDAIADTRAARSITEGARASAEGGHEQDSGPDRRNTPAATTGVPAAPRAERPATETAARGGETEAPGASGREAGRAGIRSAEAVYRQNGTRTAVATRGPATSPGAATAARVLQTQAAKLLAEAAPTGRTVTVSFRDAGGAEGRILLSLRGRALAATVVSSNRETVKRLESELGEIQRSLGERGFAEARVEVRQARAVDRPAVAEETRRDPEPDRDGSRGGENGDSRRRSRREPGSGRTLPEVPIR